MARIAIAGNPNAGKSCIFNALTGSNQRVTNYPGVTVERKEGSAIVSGTRLGIVDLPGTYSLTAYSTEERVARDVILDEAPDVVLNVVDAANLERNLYLTVQLMEMGAPLVMALNMVDLAERRGIGIDLNRLSQLLGFPIVATVGCRGIGCRELLEACAAEIDRKNPTDRRDITYGHEVDGEVRRLADLVSQCEPLSAHYRPRWVAVKLLESDEDVEAKVRKHAEANSEALLKAAEESRRAIALHYGEDPAALIAERRYGFAAGAVREAQRLGAEARQNATDLIDNVVCHRALGPVLLVGVVATLFYLVFKISDEWRWVPWFGGFVSPTGLFEWFFAKLSELVAPLEAHAPVLHSLINDGVIGGVGGVMGFVPLIFILFLLVSALEDTGYIARVAFLLDRVLRSFGLQGKSILAMIVSGGLGAGGCAVPGVLATRTLRDEKDRLVTMLVVPLMSCGAKMPVYAMLVAAFFSDNRAGVMLLLWGISWAVALGVSWLLRRFVVRGENAPFVMELPPYHTPTVHGVLMHSWDRTWMYVKKAGTIILAVNILMWSVVYFPRMSEEERAAALGAGGPGQESAATLAAAELAHSFAGRVGTVLEPASRLAGFDWRTNIALFGGVAAKEVIVGTLGTVYAMNDAEPQSLSDRLAKSPAWNPLKAFALMVFVMLYSPCFVTLVVIGRESGSWKWALFAMAYSTAVAYVLAVIVYQGGRLMGLGV